MTNVTPEARPFSAMSDESLLNGYAYEERRLEEVQTTLDQLRQEIIRRMAEAGATSIPSELFVCELQARTTYDQSGFTPLLELLNEADLKTCYTAEHTEEVRVPAKWNTVKVNALARRYGEVALRIVEAAKMVQPSRLVFKRR